MKSIKSITSNNSRLLLVVCFLILACLARQYSYFNLDLQISQAIQGIHQSQFSLVMNLVSGIGDDYHLGIVVGLVTLILLFLGRKSEAIRSVSIAAISYFTGTLLKLMVARPRPDPGLVRIQEALSDFSFPSLHVLVFTAFFGYLFYLSITGIKTPWLRFSGSLICAFLILTIGVSRIYLGAHWASDVLGGYLVGAIFISYITDHAQR